MGLSDLCVYSLSFSHQLPARNQRGNDSLPQEQLAVFLLAIYLNIFNKKKKKKIIQGHKNPLLQQCLAQELASSQPFIQTRLQSVTLDAGLSENKEKLLIQLER